MPERRPPPSDIHDAFYELHTAHEASIKDLHIPRFVEEYLEKAPSGETLAGDACTLEEQLAAAKLTVAPNCPIPTVLGLLTIGKNPLFFLPGAYVQFLRFESETLAGAISDDLVIHGPVSDIVRRLDDKLLSHNRVAVEPGHVEKRTGLYPMRALRELTRNAIMHRPYDSNMPIRVYWYSDRIEIINAGPAFGSVRGHLGEPGFADYRNPNLADYMRDIRLVRRTGGGIQRARQALEEGGNPPLDFYEDSIVRVTVYPNKAYRW